MKKTVFFDLDGTLLRMEDQDLFVETYFGLMAKKLAPLGYESEALLDAVWKGTAAMIANDGSRSNEEVFWAVFCGHFGKNCREDEPVFVDYYTHEFQQVAQVCGRVDEAAETVRLCKDLGAELVLATNPLFPAIATESRIRWAGLDKDDFELYTTYENSRRCKPNPDYYREVLEKLGCDPAECLMVGNDAHEDMIAEKLGMRVFLLTDCLLNRKGADVSAYPQGSYPELLSYIESL